MFKGKILLDYTNLSSPNDYEKNDIIVLKRFRSLKILYCVICGKHRIYEKPKISYIFGQPLTLSIISSKRKNEEKSKKKVN